MQGNAKDPLYARHSIISPNKNRLNIGCAALTEISCSIFLKVIKYYNTKKLNEVENQYNRVRHMELRRDLSYCVPW